MTDNDIIKALECCPSDSKTHDCSKCQYKENVFCFELLIKDALDLINRQKAEIERLQIVHKYIDETIIGNKEFAIADEYLIAYQNALKQLYDNTKIRAAAIKEFAERLKEDLRTGEPIRDNALRDVIDNLVKEMVGDNNDG